MNNDGWSYSQWVNDFENEPMKIADRAIRRMRELARELIPIVESGIKFEPGIKQDEELGAGMIQGKNCATWRHSRKSTQSITGFSMA